MFQYVKISLLLGVMSILLINCGESEKLPPKAEVTVVEQELDAYSQKIKTHVSSELGEAYNLPSPEASAAQLKLGKNIYVQHCSGCHGSNGQGDGMVARQLQPKPSDFTNAQTSSRFSDQGRMYIIKHGLNGFGAQMMGYKDFLSDDEVFAVYSYVKSLARR